MRLSHFYFKFNKFNPDAGKRQSLDRLIEVLKTYPTLTLQVEGHTDPVGAAAYNVRLSRRRATAVRNYIVEQGIDGTRVVAVGFGEVKPIGDNTTKDGRRENRRVEIRFTSPIPEDLRIQLLRLEF